MVIFITEGLILGGYRAGKFWNAYLWWILFPNSALAFQCWESIRVGDDFGHKNYVCVLFMRTFKILLILNFA